MSKKSSIAFFVVISENFTEHRQGGVHARREAESQFEEICSNIMRQSFGRLPLESCTNVVLAQKASDRDTIVCTFKNLPPIDDNTKSAICTRINVRLSRTPIRITAAGVIQQIPLSNVELQEEAVSATS